MKRKQIIPAVCLYMTVIHAFFSFLPLYASESDMISHCLSKLSIRDPIVAEKLVVFPLVSDSFTDDISFITLEEALEHNVLEITEVEGGRVPQVHLKSVSDHSIFIMGGEVLSGCKQDRIVGRDIIIAPHKELIVPVYCVEHGRWTYESGNFYSMNNAGTYNLRSIAQSEDGNAQSKIWNEVSKMNHEMGVDTHTGAYQDAYEKGDIQKKIAECEEILLPLPDKEKGIVGVIIGVGTKIVSIDLFTSPLLFKKLWPKILKASVLSGLSSKDEKLVSKADSKSFLDNVAHKNYTIRAAVGSGFEISSCDDELSVNALVSDNHIVHIAAFPPVEYDEEAYYQENELQQVDFNLFNRSPNQINNERLYFQEQGNINKEDEDDGGME